jgi:hypothetical protein
MRGQRYRLLTPTLALFDEPDHPVTVTICVGDVVEVIDGDTDNRWVHVLWEGRTVMMFSLDLKTRGEALASSVA